MNAAAVRAHRSEKAFALGSGAALQASKQASKQQMPRKQQVEIIIECRRRGRELISPKGSHAALA
jgi:hypothetical protein